MYKVQLIWLEEKIVDGKPIGDKWFKDIELPFVPMNGMEFRFGSSAYFNIETVTWDIEMEQFEVWIDTKSWPDNLDKNEQFDRHEPY